MKRKWAIVVMLCVFLIGCGSAAAGEGPGNDTAFRQGQTIEKLTVTYAVDTTGGDTDQIRIDFIDGTREMKQFRGNEVLEQTEPYENVDELLSFVKDTLLPALEEETEGKESSEQMILWNISVQTDEQSYHMKGFNEYPVYWDELLEYLEKNQVRRNDSEY